MGVISRFVPDKDLFGGLDRLVVGVKELQKVLTDPTVTSYRVVLNPEKMVIKEGARAVTYLSLFGYPVDAAVVNRVLPGVESDGLGNTWISEASNDQYLFHLQEIQARYLGEIERDFMPLPILRSRWFDQEMVGVPRLRELAPHGLRRPGSRRDPVCWPGPDGRGRRRGFHPQAAAAPGRTGQGAPDQTGRRALRDHWQLQA